MIIRKKTYHISGIIDNIDYTAILYSVILAKVNYASGETWVRIESINYNNYSSGAMIMNLAALDSPFSRVSENSYYSKLKPKIKEEIARIYNNS